MKVLSIIWTICIVPLCLLGQMGSDDVVLINAELYGGLPVEVSMIIEDEMITGWSKYGSNGELQFNLEGEKTEDNKVILYEFEDDHVLSGILEGDLDEGDWIWNSTDYALNIPVKRMSKDPLDHQVLSVVDYQSFIAVKYPLLVDEKFDAIMMGRLTEAVKSILGEYAKLEQNEGSNIPSHRFSKRAIGVSKVTLESENIISGYITIYDNQKSDVQTITYTYDKGREDLLGLDDLFKKNFNYSFFLKQYINQKKKDMVGLVSQLEAVWLDNEKFTYYVLTPGGFKFFSNHNTIFGRKSFHIPYYEVESSLDNRSLVNYLKKRK